MKNNPVPAIEQTYKSIKTILEKARSKSFKAVNSLMVQAYWHIGKVIVEGDSKRDWTRLAKALNGEVNEELIEHFRGVESLPFSAGEHNQIAVKIIDNRGIESFAIKKLE